MIDFFSFARGIDPCVSRGAWERTRRIKTCRRILQVAATETAGVAINAATTIGIPSCGWGCCFTWRIVACGAGSLEGQENRLDRRSLVSKS
jgi:hypothetical protein